MKRFLILLILPLLPLFLSHAASPPTVRDKATTELLIKFHKHIAAEEDAIIAKIRLQLEEQKGAKKNSKDFRKLKKKFTSRLTNVYNYAALLPRIIPLVTDTKELIEEVYAFSTYTFRDFKKLPICMAIYSNAIGECMERVVFLEKQLSKFAFTSVGSIVGIRLYTASDYNILLSNIESTVWQCKSIIRNAYMYCSFLCSSGIKQYYAYKILNKRVTNNIRKNVLAKLKVK